LARLAVEYFHLLQRVLILLFLRRPLPFPSPSASRCPHTLTAAPIRLKTSSASTTGWARKSTKAPSVFSSRVRLLPPYINSQSLRDLASYPRHQPAQLCERIIVDPGYLGSLHCPNVTSTYDEIKRVVPEGVQLKTGELVPLDVLIFGTGFSVVRR